MPKQEQRAVAQEKEKKPLMIDGLEDFPLKLLGLSVDSIERSNGHIKVPVELLPYLRICKTPVLTRKIRAKIQHEYYLRLKTKELRKDIEEGKVKVKKPSRSTRRR